MMILMGQPDRPTAHKRRHIMKIEITIDCPECEGYGKTETTTGGWTAAGPWMEYVTHECHHCDGEGEENIVVDEYETLADARLDYPKSKMEAA